MSANATTVTHFDTRVDPARLFWRFYGGLVAVVAVLAILAAWMLVRQERADGFADIRADLRHSGHLTAELLGPALASGDAVKIAESMEVARSQGIRITVIGVDGSVLADSVADPADMDNHLDRPEILGALRAGAGESERVSRTFGEYLLYYAEAISRDGVLRGFVRSAETGRDVARREAGLVRNMALGILGLVAGTLAVGFLVVRQIGGQFRGEIALLLERDALYERLKASQEALASKEHRLNEAQHIAHLGSWTWDVRTNEVTWSDGQFRTFGLEPGAIVPTHEAYMSFVHPDDRSFAAESIAAALKTVQPFEFDQRIVWRDGTVRILHSRGEVTADAHGVPVEVLGTGQDVTERVAAQEAQRKSEERFQLAMLATNDALWDWVPGTNDLWWSDGFFRLFGYARNAVAPTLDARVDLIHQDDRSAIDDSIEEFLASDRAVWTGEYRFHKADGTYAWVFDRGYVVRAGGVPSRMIGSMMDITTRKEAERMKSDFVSFVSHQLRTPLSGMNWMLELASDTPDLPPIARGYIAEARESADRLGGLVNDLLDVSKLESGRLALTLESVELGELTRSVLGESRALVEDKGHQLRVELPEAAVRVLADAQLMRQVIANLISNAIKYTPPRGTLVVALAAADGHLRWTVTDSGIGIPKAAQPRLFEKFYRAENALAMETEGTGLGLHLVRLIIEQFGGTVWCDSEEGHGATFGFALPVAEAV